MSYRSDRAIVAVAVGVLALLSLTAAAPPRLEKLPSWKQDLVTCMKQEKKNDRYNWKDGGASAERLADQCPRQRALLHILCIGIRSEKDLPYELGAKMCVLEEVILAQEVLRGER